MRLSQVVLQRGGQNVKFHYYDRPFFSEHKNCLFSSSLLRHQNIKSVFLVHHYYYNQNIKSLFLVDHYYDTFDVLILPMASKKITTSKIKISTTHGILPMDTKACGALGGQVRVNQVRLGQVRFHYVNLGQIRLGFYFYFFYYLVCLS